MIPILLLVTASFRPPAPTVGDLITINFQQLVHLDASAQYEIVSQRGRRVVIRTFEPKPFTISGRVGDVLFRNMVVPVHSVLKPRDNLSPAPLKPPRSEPTMPMIAVTINPPGSFPGIISLASAPTIKPRRARIFGIVTFPSPISSSLDTAGAIVRVVHAGDARHAAYDAIVSRYAVFQPQAPEP